jgi:hypothetical protein
LTATVGVVALVVVRGAVTVGALTLTVGVLRGTVGVEIVGAFTVGVVAVTVSGGVLTVTVVGVSSGRLSEDAGDTSPAAPTSTTKRAQSPTRALRNLRLRAIHNS